MRISSYTLKSARCCEKWRLDAGLSDADGSRIRPCQEQDCPQVLIISPSTVYCLIGTGAASIQERRSNRVVSGAMFRVIGGAGTVVVASANGEPL